MPGVEGKSVGVGRPSRALDRAPLSLTREELTRLHSLILKLDKDASTRHLVQGMRTEKSKFANALLALEPYDNGKTESGCASSGPVA